VDSRVSSTSSGCVSGLSASPCLVAVVQAMSEAPDLRAQGAPGWVMTSAREMVLST
jgi:hypothetical protein